ncbi:ZP domain-containing protein [Caerostris extrusa]|uniref:ZP domain-containing protein n=1 Tax=Caerostris extrusa TaxID=172846 RepID=A0AAV4THV0_CAEEX|nr:ZP domain-containing protein [Caerostris extrusa]
MIQGVPSSIYRAGENGQLRIEFSSNIIYATNTFGTDIPYDTDTESLQTSSTSTTLSLLDYNETTSNVTEKLNDSFTSDTESSENRFVSLTKDLAVEDTGNLKEFVITRKVPDTLTTSDNVILDLTSQSDVSATEDMPFALSHSMKDSENQTVGNNNNEEIISHVNSTETLNNNLNVTGRMLRDEESIDLSTKSMIKPEALTTLDLLNENETRLYIDLDSTEPLANATTLHYYEKSSKPYFTTQTESDTELNENKTLMTTVEMNAKNDEIKINETDMAGNENNAPTTLREQREGPNQSYTDFKEATSTADHFEYSPDSTIDTTEKDNFEYSDSNEDSSKETKLIVNSTRIPKRIQNKQERYPEGRVRPARPDPGYTNRQEIDLVRPYRPDSPINQYPYYRPTPDSRTPIIRQDITLRPLRRKKPSTRQSTFNSATAKPYRPSFNHPYVPQGSFGRPYRPDYQRPSSKPDGITYKPSTSGTSSHDLELFEHSRADYEYTRQSESVPVYSKNSPSESRRPVKPEESRPYLSNRPVYDIITEDPVESNPIFNDANSKIPKPSIETARPASFYPKPGFGNNYLPSDTSLKPFSVGTVVSTKNLTRVECNSGYTQDSSCNYVNGSGRNHYEFFIRLNRCGTLGQQEVSEDNLGPITRRRQERAQYLVNTVTVQYNPVIEEDIDEHFRVTCEYGYDFGKQSSVARSASVKLRTGSPVVFTLPPPQCNMEVRRGFGPSGIRISGPVNVGDPITLVIHMKSESTGFDILVSNCFAHNGAQKRLQLIDSNGCVIQENLSVPSEPQRCYWRNLYKRSAEELTTEASTESDSVVSESVSLFQALEVRHVEVDSPMALKNSHWKHEDDMVCIRTGRICCHFCMRSTFIAVDNFYGSVYVHAYATNEELHGNSRY